MFTCACTCPWRRPCLQRERVQPRLPGCAWLLRQPISSIIKRGSGVQSSSARSCGVSRPPSQHRDALVILHCYTWHETCGHSVMFTCGQSWLTMFRPALRQIGSGVEVVTLAEPGSGEHRSTGCAASPRATSSSRYQPEDHGLRPRWKVLTASGAPRSGVMSCPFQKGWAAPRAVRACRRCTARAPPRRPRWATSRACRAGVACQLHSLRLGQVPWRC